jgi:fatty-acid desaturase
MDSVLFSGVFELSWWGYVAVALVLTHVTIVAVTVFLHRHQAHHALDLHPAASQFFRLWLWLTTGMKTREMGVSVRQGGRESRHHRALTARAGPRTGSNATSTRRSSCLA